MVDQGFWGLEDPLQMRIAIAMTVVASLAFLGFGMFFGGPRPPLGMAIILIATLVINTFAMLLALLLLSGLIDFEFISLDGGILKMAAVVSMQLAIMLIPPEWLGAILAAITGLYLLYYFFDLTYINLFFAGAAFNMIHYAGRWFLPILD